MIRLHNTIAYKVTCYEYTAVQLFYKKQKARVQTEHKYSVVHCKPIKDKLLDVSIINFVHH